MTAKFKLIVKTKDEPEAAAGADSFATIILLIGYNWVD